MTPDWLTPAVGALGSAVIGVLFTVLGWWVQRKSRIGDWESIKLDLEIADLLDPDDPLAKWLREYAKVRIEAYALDETGIKRNLPEIIGNTLMLAVNVIIVVWAGRILIDSFRNSEWGWVAVGGVIFLILVAATSVPLEGIFNSKRYYKVGGIGQIGGHADRVSRLRTELMRAAEGKRSTIQAGQRKRRT